ncbi:MAG: alpha/beta fold hydrolase [Sphingomonas sp.]|jgi:hypothetical protein
MHNLAAANRFGRRVAIAALGLAMGTVVPLCPARAQTSQAPSLTELTTAGPLAPLHGTLLRPANPADAPVVLILPGSGPTDRDGNNPLGVSAASYRLLAEALAAHGIAALRIDKRGLGASRAAVANGNAVTIADYVRDVRGWVAAARAATGARCVWLLGHSEGGLVALATGDAPGVCGHVLVASVGRPFGVVIREQLRANPANAAILPQAEATLVSLEKGERVDVSMLHPALQALFSPAVQGYFIDLLAHDPAKMAAALKLPMVIVQGLSDVQVAEADARALAAARPDAQLVMVPGMNHVLKQIGAQSLTANFATYSNPNLPIDPALVDAVAQAVAHR